MSDTPRTDAAARHVSVDRAGCIMLWHSETGGYVERKVSEQLERENAALRQDRERLDWLERRTAFFQLFRKDGVVFVQLVGETGPHECTSTRDAIDAARAKEDKP